MSQILELDRRRVTAAFDTVVAHLENERESAGYWVGELSTSALSTATAVVALALAGKERATTAYDDRIRGGLRWLADHQNTDGGWGDTVKSFSNISTTMLCRAAVHAAGAANDYQSTLQRCERWLALHFGPTAADWAAAVRARYGKDRTFAVPILMTSALAGLSPWDEVDSLPFELACFPQSWFRFLRLHVVSYALPALIAVGQVIHAHRQGGNPVTRAIRNLARQPSLRVLERIQPENGGFLEAVPLTSFVTMSLVAIGSSDHPVAKKGISFILDSVRPDGSWPIDTNLSTWVTTLSINALAASGHLANLSKLDSLLDWLLEQQHRARHPYTGAAPGGWAWTPLPGGVPDADDTPGALLALLALRQAIGPEAETRSRCDDAVFLGVRWLIDLQNRDGGWPTFCRGWGHLPFDRSGADLTAHALRALAKVQAVYRDELRRRRPYRLTAAAIGSAIDRGLAYLEKTQRPDGSWLPLWFGNQHAEDESNPTYGTSRVLAAFRDLDKMNTDSARRGLAWLAAHQNEDGGWGAGSGTPSSVEETSLALEVLLDNLNRLDGTEPDPTLAHAVNKGLARLVEFVEAGKVRDPAPIGFYFAKLWYYEKLYPLVYALAALGKAVQSRQTGER